VTTNEIILAVVCAVLVVFSLTVALVIPKRNPDFPGRRGLGVFFTVALVLVVGMLASVELIGEEETAEAEAGEVAEPGAPAEEPAGEAPAGEPPAGEEPPPGETEGGETPGDPTAGAEVFATAGCGSCHALADAGAAGAVGPNLDESQPSYELVVDRVTNGQGAMPAFGDTLSEQQIQDVSAYVVQATGQ
jgi:mono/diheme cytochrome c family protein